MLLRLSWPETVIQCVDSVRKVCTLPLSDGAFLSAVLGRYERKVPGAVLHLGMGGSALGIKALAQAAGIDSRRLVICDEPEQLATILSSGIPFSTVVAASKSGGTAEILSMLGTTEAMLPEETRWIALTNEPQSAVARAVGALGGSVASATNGTGGRYSGLQPVNLLSLALAGEELGSIPEWSGWDAVAQRATEKDFEIAGLWVYPSAWTGVVEWWNQLVAESLGQRGKGVVPLAARAPHAQHSVAQLVLEGRFRSIVFLIVGDPERNGKKSNPNSQETLCYAMARATASALVDAGVDVVWCGVDPYRLEDMAGFMLFAMRSIAAWGLASDMNPFVQPGVEAIKMHLRSGEQKLAERFAARFSRQISQS